MFPNILYHQNLSNGNIFVTNNFITKLVNVSHGKYSCSVLNHSSSAPLASMMSHSHSLQQSSHTLSPAHKKNLFHHVFIQVKVAWFRSHSVAIIRSDNENLFHCVYVHVKVTRSFQYSVVVAYNRSPKRANYVILRFLESEGIFKGLFT